MENEKNTTKILFHICMGIFVYTFNRAMAIGCIYYCRDFRQESFDYNIITIIMNPLLILLVVCFGILLSLFILPKLPEDSISAKILSRFELLMWGIMMTPIIIVTSSNCMLVY